jgi:hypothetical protein
MWNDCRYGLPGRWGDAVRGSKTLLAWGFFMTTAYPASGGGAESAALFKGGPGLIDLLIDATELEIAVTGPKMLFERLELLTTLSVFDGYNVHRLRELASHLEGVIHCGLVGTQPAEITVAVHRSGATLEIDLGPASMYESDLVLRTRTGETFRALLQRLLSSDPSLPFFAALHGVTATGHLEHEHGPGDGSEEPSHEGHGEHGHPGGADHGRP